MFTTGKERTVTPHIAPDGGADFYMKPMNGSVGWSDVGIIIPLISIQNIR